MQRTICCFWWIGTLNGCGSDCDDAARLDGEWSVSTSVVSDQWQANGFDTEDSDAAVAASESIEQSELLGELPVSGTRTWTIRRDGNSDDFMLRIDGQEFQSRMVPRQGACNAFDISFEGAWSGSSGSAHIFTYEGQLNFLGDEITGEWSYSDSFTWDERDRNGTIAIPVGVLSGVRGTADSGQ
ncbi:MAG: hypothetical protein CL927_04290 [Deltaproteobacteria bacterium]|nr:hypothetical protein [Deltaproteobacteria bacterium]HCH64833.1 hypothetical protein [Deltaproteobacteria bacterium]